MQTVTVYFPSGATVRAELATDQASRQHGLMGRRSLPDGTGMLFDMGRVDRHAFWMAGTLVPLDMVFFDTAFGVVDVVERAVPLSRVPRGGRAASRYALEVPGGWAARHGVAVGQRASLVRPPS